MAASDRWTDPGRTRRPCAASYAAEAPPSITRLGNGRYIIATKEGEVTIGEADVDTLVILKNARQP